MELVHTIFSFVIVLSVIVFIHEFGHYLAARLCGVRVEEFSIGFGREIFGLHDSHGTRWKFSLLPLGGYVKMFGDETEASTPDALKLEEMSDEDKAVSFHYKSLPRKAIIVSAGPAANFILTIGIFTWSLLTTGLAVNDPIIGEVMKDTPAQAAGLQTGDYVVTIDDKKVKTFSDIPRLLATNTGTEVTIVIKRGEDTLTLPITPIMREDEDMLGNKIKRPLIGVVSYKLKFETLGVLPAIGEAVKRTWDLTLATFDYMGQLIAGKRDAEELKGPVGIAQLSGQATEKGFDTVLWFIAMLSANLGLINLFPIPPLDGGHLVYYAVEGARGRPMAQKFQEWGFRAGFALIITLMIFVTFNDIKNIVLS